MKTFHIHTILGTVATVMANTMSEAITNYCTEWNRPENIIRAIVCVA